MFDSSHKIERTVINLAIKRPCFIDGVVLVFLSVILMANGCGARKSDVSTATSATSESGTESRPKGIPFTDVAASSGVLWTVRNGEESQSYTILETLGSGCAIEDYDGDGRLDLILAGGGEFGSQNEILPRPIALYRQIDQWKFQLVTEQSGLAPILHYNHGIWTADVNDDGFSDVLITGWGGLQFFLNQGDGTYLDSTKGSGLGDVLWSTAAGWADLNRDQILDLYVGHYVDWSFKNNPACVDARNQKPMPCEPAFFQGLPCTVYLGKGDGTFQDASAEMGIQGLGKTLGSIIFDMNDDGQPDIYVANDTTENQLYLSQTKGDYRELAIEFGVALGDSGVPDGSMGVDFGDLDGDGLPELWVSNFENQSFALYRNLGHGLFTHSSRAFGVTAVGPMAVGFGTILFDADGDGYLDIFCANGHINSAFDRRQLPYLFWNDQGKRLINVAKESGEYLSHAHLGRGVACGDLDGNGSPDIVVSHLNEPVSLLRNESPIANWLSIRLVGTTSPRSAIGAMVTIQSAGRRQVGFVKGSGSYFSTSDRELRFGLGAAKAIESIEVKWPAGGKTTMENVKSGQHLVLIENQN